MKIELIYFNGCPNIKAARDNIKAACYNLKTEYSIQEWNNNDDNAPDYTKTYGSPTILVNGKDIAGVSGDCCTSGNCRIYADMTGVPSVELIKTALEKE